eukprot:1161195-Pelagomonas_calceolata.AAC.25
MDVGSLRHVQSWDQVTQGRIFEKIKQGDLQPDCLADQPVQQQQLACSLEGACFLRRETLGDVCNERGHVVHPGHQPHKGHSLGKPCDSTDWAYKDDKNKMMLVGVPT